MGQNLVAESFFGNAAEELQDALDSEVRKARRVMQEIDSEVLQSVRSKSEGGSGANLLALSSEPVFTLTMCCCCLSSPGASYTTKPTTEIEVMRVLLSDSVMGGEPGQTLFRPRGLS